MARPTTRVPPRPARAMSQESARRLIIRTAPAIVYPPPTVCERWERPTGSNAYP